jgi:predicted nucleotidyltransferase
MIDINKVKSKIKKIAEDHNLSLVILYGSQATGRANKDSDIDIAVLGFQPIRFEELADLNNKFAKIFQIKEIDVKLLHRTDSLFRFQVMRDGRLLYGRSQDFNSFRAYAFRDYFDSQDLLRLKEILIRKRLQRLAV